MEIEKQIGDNQYQNLTFKPIELVLACDYSCIAISIFKHITGYKYKNGIDNLREALQMAKCMQEINFHLRVEEKTLLKKETYLLKFKNENDFCSKMKNIIFNIHLAIYRIENEDDRKDCYKEIIEDIEDLTEVEEEEMIKITIKNRPKIIGSEKEMEALEEKIKQWRK